MDRTLLKEMESTNQIANSYSFQLIIGNVVYVNPCNDVGASLPHTVPSNNMIHMGAET